MQVADDQADRLEAPALLVSRRAHVGVVNNGERPADLPVSAAAVVLCDTGKLAGKRHPVTLTANGHQRSPVITEQQWPGGADNLPHLSAPGLVIGDLDCRSKIREGQQITEGGFSGHLGNDPSQSA